MVLGRQDVLAWALGHLFSCSAHTLPFQLWFPSVLSLHPCECSWLAHSCSCQPSFIFGGTSVKHSICLIWESSSVLKDQVVCCWSWFLSPLTLAQLMACSRHLACFRGHEEVCLMSPLSLFFCHWMYFIWLLVKCTITLNYYFSNYVGNIWALGSVWIWFY